MERGVRRYAFALALVLLVPAAHAELVLGLGAVGYVQDTADDTVHGAPVAGDAVPESPPATGLVPCAMGTGVNGEDGFWVCPTDIGGGTGATDQGAEDSAAQENSTAQGASEAGPAVPDEGASKSQPLQADLDEAAPAPRPAAPAPNAVTAPDPSPADPRLPQPAGSAEPPSTRWLAVAAAAATLLIPPWVFAKLGGLLALRRRAKEHSPVELAIVEAIQACPGIHHAELRRRLGKANGTLEHYLGRLERSGRIRSVQAGRYRCYFDTATTPAVDPGALAVKVEGRRRIVHALDARPDQSLSQLASASGIPLSVAHHHVQRLVGAGLVSASRAGRSLRLALTEAGRQLAQGLRIPSPSPSAAAFQASAAVGGLALQAEAPSIGAK